MHTVTRHLIAVVLVFTPWAFGTTEAWSLAVMEGLCVAVVLSHLLECVMDRRREWRHPWLLILGMAVMVYVGLQLLNPVTLKIIRKWSVYELQGGNLSLPHTIHWQATFALGLRWACLLAFGAVVLHHPRDRADVLFLLRVMVVNAAVLSAEGILQHLSGSHKLLGFRYPSHGGQIFGPFVCRNNYAAFANLAIPLGMGLALLPDLLRRGGQSKTQEKFFWAFCAAVCFAGVVLSGSRMGMLVALFVGGLMTWEVALRRRSVSDFSSWKLIPMVLLPIVLVVSFVGGVDQAMTRFDLTDPSEPTRVGVWKSLWDAIEISPNWGYGIGTFRYLFPFFKSTDLRFYYEYAHSDWLEAVYSLGVVGALLLALWVFGAMFALFRERWMRTSAFRRSVAGCAIISIVGCLLHALVDFPLQIAGVQLTFVAVAALGLSARTIFDGG